VRAGAPPVTLHGLSLGGEVRVEGGTVLLDHCHFGPSSGAGGRRLANVRSGVAARALSISGGDVVLASPVFEDCLGGAINVSGGKLRLLGGTLRRNHAARGGALIVSGGGEVELINATFEDNSASLSGGAIHVARDGWLLLANQTKISSATPQRERCNGTTGCGWSVYAEPGVGWRYRLPTPLAHYVTNVGDRGEAQVEQAIDLNYPYECGATLYGNSLDAYEQSGPQCSGSCDPGYYCPKETIRPIACEEGTYCPEGSPAERQCPAGRFQPERRKFLFDDCLPTVPGYYAAAGAAAPTPCAAGTAQSLPEQGTCDHCAAGKFQDKEGATSCEACRAGAFCPLGAPAASPCLAGTFAVATDLSSADECSECPRGFFCERFTSVPTPCPPGTFGGDARLVAAAACTSCPGTTHSLPGESVCRFCQANYYATDALAATGQAVCSACASFAEGATCVASTTVGDEAAAATLLEAMNLTEAATVAEVQASRELRTELARRVGELSQPLLHGPDSLARVNLSLGYWRLSGRAKALSQCCGADGGARCAGGTDGGTPYAGGDEADSTGSGYCMAGHTGPLCQVCVTGGGDAQRSYYSAGVGQCVACPRMLDFFSAVDQPGLQLLLALGALAMLGAAAALARRRYAAVLRAPITTARRLLR